MTLQQMPRIWHVQEVLQSAADTPGAPVSRLNLITPPEVAQVLKAFNAWDLPYTDLLNPETQTIHGMFEHWAKHTPEAPALTFRGEPLDCSMNLSAFPVHADSLQCITACKGWLTEPACIMHA